ncbi:hypothetical protein [Methylobacter sp.]|uniref:hypothetical protein n=1 Tax=Methylobacter sp. TaxID=2051955 RepID=UPI0012162804|nr:hypothetical protein [Methylobacter sp.]TAK62229.1 MAG: hypothetical protein EPO18_11280 [Methylobacter sp.]
MKSRSNQWRQVKLILIGTERMPFMLDIQVLLFINERIMKPGRGGAAHPLLISTVLYILIPEMDCLLECF